MASPASSSDSQTSYRNPSFAGAYAPLNMLYNATVIRCGSLGAISALFLSFTLSAPPLLLTKRGEGSVVWPLRKQGSNLVRPIILTARHWEGRVVNCTGWPTKALKVRCIEPSVWTQAHALGGHSRYRTQPLQD